jgi:hypothetical protein
MGRGFEGMKALGKDSESVFSVGKTTQNECMISHKDKNSVPRRDIQESCIYCSETE